MSITTIDFDPDKKRIEDIFDSSLSMIIPRYQRTYSWTRDNLEEFYEDFLEESENPDENLAFLGTILFSVGKDETLEVVDGQQRLITITLYFAAARDVLTNVVQTKDALLASEVLQSKIKRGPSFGSSYGKSTSSVKLTVGVEIESIFNKIIYANLEDYKKVTTKNKAERRVKEGYAYFYSKIKELVDRPMLRAEDKIAIINNQIIKINMIDYIDIRVTNQEVAYNLFESHNAKGLALAKTDLIKNYYFGRLKGNDREKNDRMDGWDRLFDRLEDETSYMLPDRFFSYMLQSYIGNFSSSMLYRKIKPFMQNPEEFFKKLSSDVESMIGLKSSSTEDKLVNNSLEAINKVMTVNQCFIFLLALYRNKDKLSHNNYVKIIRLIENFTYIYSGVTNSPTNALEKVYSKYALMLGQKIDDVKGTFNDIDKQRISGQLYDLLHKDLVEITPKFNTFLENFSALNYQSQKNRALIRYTFTRIESHHSEGMIQLGDSFTLDHIIPQKNINDKQFIYHSIGNLVPLSGPTNSSKGSNSPHQSLDLYRKNDNFYSTNLLVKMLEGNEDFTEELINKRIEQLAKYVYTEVFTY